MLDRPQQVIPGFSVQVLKAATPVIRKFLVYVAIRREPRIRQDGKKTRRWRGTIGCASYMASWRADLCNPGSLQTKAEQSFRNDDTRRRQQTVDVGLGAQLIFALIAQESL